MFVAVAMFFTLLPATVAYANADRDFDGTTFSPVEEENLDVALVHGVTNTKGDGAVDFSVSLDDTSDWNQNSGEGSVDTYTYVGVYVTAPDGATQLKYNDSGDSNNLQLTTNSFFHDGKFEHWFPIADYQNGTYTLFNGGRTYELLLQWLDDKGKVIENQYVTVTRNLADPEAKVLDKTYQTLEDAYAAVTENNSVQLLKDVEIDEMLVLNKENVGLNLGGHTISASDAFVKDSNNNNNHLVDIQADGVTLSNGTLKAGANNNHTLNVWNAEKVSLMDLTLDGSEAGLGGAPLIVGASDVSVGGDLHLVTGSNSWYALNVDSRNVGGEAVPCSLTFGENTAVSFEGTNPLGIFVENTADVAKDEISVSFGSNVDFNSVNENFVPITLGDDVVASIVHPENAGIVETEDGFVLEADKSELEALVEDLENLDSKEYTEESWEDYEIALTNALEVLDDVNATDEQIADALDALTAAYEGLVAYEPTIIAGANSTWDASSDKDLTFKSDAEYADFVKVTVDGKDLAKEYYTVTEGSTIVTLKASYLKTLEAGKHTLAIVSKTGVAETQFTVTKTTETKPDETKPNTTEKDESVDTGIFDNTSIMAMWTLVGLGFVVTLSLKKRAAK